MKIKEVLLFGILILTVVFLLGSVSAQNQTAIYCAEKTTYGASCQNVPLEEVDTNYRYDRTSCASTSYCSEGTCVNTLTGECLTGPQATCDSTQGGFFYSQPEDEVAQCKIGCCLLGDQAALVEQVRCDALGTDYNLVATFRPDIQDELTCLAMASPEAKGACVFETEQGRNCKFTTRGECQESAGEFHEGFLCSAPELGTICTRTKKTICVEGRNEVYFIDSCGNIANIYDANKIDDIAYWSYIPGVEGVEVDIGDGKGNAGSAIYGYCDYLQGSTCRSYDRGTDPNQPKYGDYICRDLGCKASLPLTGGKYREHGEEWCSEPIENFENAKPGQLSYLLYCYNGEVYYELCDSFRNKLCWKNETTGKADCVLNRWGDCFLQDNTKDCLSEDRDCKIVEGGGIVRTTYGTERFMLDSDTKEPILASCVPKYTPGFKFWDTAGTVLDSDETPISICEFSSVMCYVHYTQSVVVLTDFNVDPDPDCIELCEKERGVGFFNLGSKKECRDDCTPRCLEGSFSGKDTLVEVNNDWAKSWQNLCVSLGDCGVSGNYLGREGYNSWKDLFLGDEIDWDTLPNANKKK